MTEKMPNQDSNLEYISRRRKLKGLFFETALPNEYLVQIGARQVKPTKGGKRFSLFRKFLRIPASIQTLEFSTDNANIHFQGLGIDGFASWQINPQDPVKAIESLDLFDEDDPMARTNAELKLICIEAVRHVIANMTIEDALRKKNDIAQSLKQELSSIEETWGIVFHQVGIKKVMVMSSQLFNDLQSDYRNEIRLKSEKKRIESDTLIASEENIRIESEEKEKIESQNSIQSLKLQSQTRHEQDRIEQQKILSQKQNELSAFEKQLELKLNQEHELALLEIQNRVTKSRCALADLENQIATFKRKSEQSFSQEYLIHEIIKAMPQMAANLDIANYTVLDSGSGAVSPVSKIIQEMLTLLKSNGFFIDQQLHPKAEDT